jgi:uncharacterized protein (TIGR02466 family)
MTEVKALFVSEIYQSSLAEEAKFQAFNAELAHACRMLAAEDRAGRAWCKANGYAGYTSYASLNDLPQRASVFGALKRKLDRHAAAYAQALNFDLHGHRLKLDSLWVNVLRPGGAHSSHIHPNSVLSGTIYVETPEGSGALKLEDPRLPLMMAAPDPSGSDGYGCYARLADAPETQKRFVSLAPTPGAIFIWESWLRHEVAANAAKAARISLSFNYA